MQDKNKKELKKSHKRSCKYYVIRDDTCLIDGKRCKVYEKWCDYYKHKLPKAYIPDLKSKERFLQVDYFDDIKNIPIKLIEPKGNHPDTPPEFEVKRTIADYKAYDSLLAPIELSVPKHKKYYKIEKGLCRFLAFKEMNISYIPAVIKSSQTKYLTECLNQIGTRIRHYELGDGSVYDVEDNTAYVVFDCADREALDINDIASKGKVIVLRRPKFYTKEQF